MTLLGLLWAAFAPLSLVMAIALLSWALGKAKMRRVFAWALAALLVVSPVAALWWRDHAEFIAVCEGEGSPMVYRRAKAEGIFLNSATSNSFGMRYLQGEGFTWVEAPSIYKRGAWVRYQRAEHRAVDANGATAITTTDIAAITAQFEVREDFSRPYEHSSLSQTRIIDRSSGEVLAKAGTVRFNGGRVKWLLGAWGAASCPSAMRSPEHFQAYYHLAKNTLR